MANNVFAFVLIAFLFIMLFGCSVFDLSYEKKPPDFEKLIKSIEESYILNEFIGYNVGTLGRPGISYVGILMIEFPNGCEADYLIIHKEFSSVAKSRNCDTINNFSLNSDIIIIPLSFLVDSFMIPNNIFSFSIKENTAIFGTNYIDSLYYDLIAADSCYYDYENFDDSQYRNTKINRNNYYYEFIYLRDKSNKDFINEISKKRTIRKINENWYYYRDVPPGKLDYDILFEN